MVKTLHKRNLHNCRYDFEELIKSEPSLSKYVSLNKYDELSIDFSNPKAVMLLNKALLKHFYNIKFYKIPKKYLCPPIPSRADYIHYMADILALSNNQEIPIGKNVKILDIGMGANCIYPIIGSSVYNWSFIGSDIDEVSIKSALSIVEQNETLKDKIKCILQVDKKDIFNNIISKNDKFDFTMCNPPFHSSQKEALKSAKRKVQNLTKTKVKNPILNFAGQENELWCDGGELSFIKKMINESLEFKNNCFWFSSLVSKKENLELIYKELKIVNPFDIKTIDMKQGNKITRIVTWTFLNKEQQKLWNKKR